MIISTTICLDTLYKLGKNYKWKKPKSCPRCQNKLWGHGFVASYFDGFERCFYIKRYRCSCCNLVIRMRPVGYLKYFQHNIDFIFQALKYKINNYKWPSWCSRQKGGHWLRRFISRLRFAKGYEDINYIKCLEEYFTGGLSF
jgi:hypothetical protein